MLLDLKPKSREERASLLQTKLSTPASPALEGLHEAHALGALNRSCLDALRQHSRRHEIDDTRELYLRNL